MQEALVHLDSVSTADGQSSTAKEIFKVPEPVLLKDKVPTARITTNQAGLTSQPLQSPSLVQDPAPAAVPGTRLTFPPAPTPFNHSSQDSSFAGAATSTHCVGIATLADALQIPSVKVSVAEGEEREAAQQAKAAAKKAQRNNRTLRSKLLQIYGCSVELKDEDETWDENNLVLEEWLAECQRSKGSGTAAAGPSSQA